MQLLVRGYFVICKHLISYDYIFSFYILRIKYVIIILRVEHMQEIVLKRLRVFDFDGKRNDKTSAGEINFDLLEFAHVLP